MNSKCGQQCAGDADSTQNQVHLAPADAVTSVGLGLRPHVGFKQGLVTRWSLHVLKKTSLVGRDLYLVQPISDATAAGT
jgi:hypothetical protein